ncbi:PD40 domain-containing protein [Pyxidicoccus parkwayensis]|uniref:PD40 domain-containing protein n=1 Tax=Pyxidicoccus parkwayensis TaxID=2813578 RepID=A0ABX7NVE1_9BACT|nr:amidohydrolase family protein [Pyxidicoccus parkwaysis]QSQ21364.1 PD40 domain-containing protein [Pyxidicoccus parkwaysis]
MKRLTSALCAALLLPGALLAAPPTTPPAAKQDQPPPPEQKQKDDAAREAARAAEVDGGTPATADAKDAAKEGEEKDAWKVDAPGFPATQVSIDVTEGTWMNVDVSPKGDALVFDLLGDIYELPIGGGEAKSLTSGVAWDMQPRYSPDGKSIAFTSDRGGGDNIWVMKRDGSKPQAVTQEKFRLLNSPAWSPDGQFIVARKHFTARRSLGAGEVWMYHRSGGEGVQLTERANDQKDLGEPAFSPDGRYVYFSQDVTPGKTFEYNKDPNGEIYAIQRLDLDTKEIDPFVSGPGGSIRPTPSRDGKQLAFIRRVRGKSVLYVTDVASGAERPLYDGLDRDMQETWAIHGVYPSMAWTPDNQIVFWAGGKLQRIDVASKKVSVIPFHVRDTRTIFQAVRTPQAVAPEKFEAKMLRWVQVSPRGDRVVYQALGKLYVRDLPNGTPKRLTKQEDHLEFYPSFSRDGKSIVYTTWDDEKFGSIRVASATGGEGKVLTTQPGYYVEPALSPDGRSLVYRATGDGYLMPGQWSRETGLFVMPASGGPAKRLSRDGEQPHFGARSDRVYFLHVESKEKEDVRSLKSIGLDGGEERTHLTSAEATEYRVSPDEQWVAFRENFNAFITPFPRGAKSAAVGPDAKALPVARVTKDAGEYLHWSGDGKRLHWALGPELYTRELKDSFAFMDGAPEKLPAAPEKGVDISFLTKSDVPEGTLAFVGGRVITMKGDEVLENGVVVVKGNRIVAVGPAGKVQVPSGAKVVDVKGKTLMPGLIDVHWHGAMGVDGLMPEQSWVHAASLSYGVTTLHDPSNSSEQVFAASELGKTGALLAPRIFSTGTILYGASGAGYRAPIDSLEDARSHLRRMKAIGAFSVKSYNQPRRDQRQKILQAARELGMLVVPEGGSLLEHNLTMVVDGHTGVEHAIPVARIYADVRQLWGKSTTGYTPTLGVAYGGNWGENYWYQTTNVWEDERLLSFVPRRLVDSRSRRRMEVPEDELNHFNAARVARELNDSGVSVQLGAHGQREGLAAHWEISMMGQGGMKPLQALRVGTLNGARYLGMDGEIGSLEEGKLADLIVLDKNPLEALQNTRTVRYTMVNGHLYDAATLNEVGTRQRQRAKFFFEKDGNEGWSPKATAHTVTHECD